MAQCFERSHQAYASGDGARAKELSNEGKRHKQEMERLNKEASEWIYIGMCHELRVLRVSKHGEVLRGF